MSIHETKVYKEITIAVDYCYAPGGKPIGPSLSDPGDPGWDPEVSINRFSIDLGDGVVITSADLPKELRSKIETLIQDEYYQDLCCEAEEW